jgi:parallel beta-helix repeat protein
MKFFVFVYNGIYYENVVVNKVIDLIGESKENVIVDGGGSSSTKSVVVSAGGVNMSNFTMTNGNRYGLWLESSGNKIADCIIYSNTERAGIMLYKSQGSNNEIRDCTIYGNKYGVWFYSGAAGNNVIDCVCHDNADYGFYFNSPNNNIINCTAYNESRAVYVKSSSGTGIMNCDIYDNSDGIYATSSPNANIVNTDCYDNSKGIYLSSSSDSNITNGQYDNNSNDISLHYSPNTKLRDNDVNSLGITGGSLSDLVQDIDTSNTFKGKPIWYLVGQSNVVIDGTSNCGYLGLISCDNITA